MNKNKEIISKNSLTLYEKLAIQTYILNHYLPKWKDLIPSAKEDIFGPQPIYTCGLPPKK